MTTHSRRSSFLVFGAPDLGEEEIEEVVSSMRAGWLGTGPKVQRFERDFAAYKGVDDAVALNSCTAALHLSILAAGIGEGDEVITTPLTFCATANAILHAGAKPVLVDVDRETMNIDPSKIEAKITKQTKAILPVHFAGRPCEMDAIQIIASKHQLAIIEDCAHAIESTYRDRKVGTFGSFAAFSFYVTKNVATGEGGMVIAKQAADLARIRILGLHGMSKDAWKRFGDEGFKHYDVVECGFKYNMMDIQAAIGIPQLKKVERNWLRREQIWQQYNDAFADLPITLPAAPALHTRHAYHLYTILVEAERAGIARDAFLDHMTREQIGVGVHYRALCEHPFYQKALGWQPDDVPEATRIGRATVSLPISPKLTDGDVSDVIAAVRKGLRA